ARPYLPRDRLVQLPHAEARIPIPPRVRPHLAPSQPCEPKRRVPEVKQADPLRRPVRRDLGRRDPPQLSRVRTEERLVQRPAEARGHPIFEPPLRRRRDPAPRPLDRIACERAPVLAPAEVLHEIARLERVLEAPSLVEHDALALLGQKVVAE